MRTVTSSEKKTGLGKADRDIIALGIATAAIIMFVGTGGQVVPDVMRSVLGSGEGPDRLLANALLLNIALIIFGWRRYRELTGEIEERRNAEAVARRLAETDPLTGCLNRRSMAEAVAHLRDVCTKEGQALALVMVDLDNFKQVNDMNGHSVGDRVLCVVSERLARRLPESGVLARLGGDEFAFAMPYDHARRERFEHFVTSLFDTIGAQMEIGGVTVDTTMSIGIATGGDPADGAVDYPDADTMIHRADIAMYQAKKQGKNRYFWFEPAMEKELRLRNELEKGIRAGIELGEFVPYYEQQIDLESGELVGFEMLARWESPELGLVNPEVFIPVAEEIGVIAALSEKLMIRAFADAKEWDPALTLSVNISPVQLRDPWFSQRLLKLMVEHSFPPARLEIEITESCLHENVGMVRAMISNLRNQGVQISLDDFGTGYSSLEQLRTLPFDRIKIDRSFIRNVRDADASAKIVDAIIALGDGLKMPITAEGIEDEEILARLRQMGKLKGQGYYYGRPERAEKVRERLKEKGQLAEDLAPPNDMRSDHGADASVAAAERSGPRRAEG